MAAMINVHYYIITLLALSLSLAPANARHIFRNNEHLAKRFERRSLSLANDSSSNATDSGGNEILTFVTPSPGATPVAITTQSQIVTSYVAQFTLCDLPPVAQVVVTSGNYSITTPSTSYTPSIGTGTGTCTTIYSPTITMVCATVLSGLASRHTVSSCNQDITFSSQFGFVLVTPTASSSLVVTASSGNATSIVTDIPDVSISVPSAVSALTGLSDSSLNTSTISFTIPTSSGNLLSLVDTIPTLISSVSDLALSTTTPSASLIDLIRRDTITAAPVPTIQTLTTYYVAPWQQLTAAGAPSDVDQKVCTTLDDGTVECVVEYYIWQTSLATITTLITTSINLTTTIHGPSQFVVETLTANLTGVMTTYSLNTAMFLEYATEIETTSTATRNASTTSLGQTVFETVTLLQASSTT